MNGTFDPVTVDQLKGRVGSILLLWSRIERAVDADIEALGGATRRPGEGFAQRLAAWERLLDEADAGRRYETDFRAQVLARIRAVQDIRNRLCHGLLGVTADPSGHYGDAGLRTELNGEVRAYGRDALDRCLTVMAHLDRAIGAVSSVAREPVDARASALVAATRGNHMPDWDG
ncbi:hypothetical protein [Vannielia sp. SX4]|uniref:hypothetical protein n=1 Tax=Vannielia sp. SX4 TaxID=3463852 RepID=UPI0040588B3B